MLAAGEPLLVTELAYAVGWHQVSVETPQLAGRTASLTLVVESETASFPVAFDISLP